MSPSATDYRRLHDLHIQLKQIQDQLTKGPRQIKARQARVVAAQDELARKEAALKEVRALADRKNLDLKAKETHLGDMQAKLNQASTNREYDIIRGQLEADQAAKAVLEDEILEALDRVDDALQEIQAAKANIVQLEQETRDFATEFERTASSLQNDEVQLKKQISEAEVIIPSDIRSQYQRLIEAYGPEGMADCSGGVCSNCFVQVTQQSRVLLNSGKLLFCGSCGRLLYHGE